MAAATTRMLDLSFMRPFFWLHFETDSVPLRAEKEELVLQLLERLGADVEVVAIMVHVLFHLQRATLERAVRTAFPVASNHTTYMTQLFCALLIY